MPIKFKVRRTTKAIRVNFRNLKGMNMTKLKKASRQAGLLDTGHHMILFRDGSLHYDRDLKAVAQTDFIENEECIYLLVDARDAKGITDAERYTLDQLTLDYNLPIIYNEV